MEIIFVCTAPCPKKDLKELTKSTAIIAVWNEGEDSEWSQGQGRVCESVPHGPV